MKIEIKSFTDDMLPQAGELLAQRHQRNRAQLPLLPARFEDPQVAVKAVSSAWESKVKRGYAAFRGNAMVAYLIGEHVTQSWGRCGYVYLPGYAFAEGENAAVMQDLYARLGDDWVRQGVFSHGLYVSAADQNLIDAWYSIGFGRERTDAMLDLRALNIPEVKEAAGVTIRRAGKGDNAHLANLSHLIANALASAPYWHPTVPEEYPELREGWAELADEEEWLVWLGLDKDEALGMIGFSQKNENHADLLAPPKTAYLNVGATKPEARGRGISTVLGWRGLEELRNKGYEVCYTNWIGPNLLASRFWPRFGFKDVSYRVAKRVDPMIAWTKGMSKP